MSELSLCTIFCGAPVSAAFARLLSPFAPLSFHFLSLAARITKTVEVTEFPYLSFSKWLNFLKTKFVFFRIELRWPTFCHSLFRQEGLHEFLNGGVIYSK